MMRNVPLLFKKILHRFFVQEEARRYGYLFQIIRKKHCKRIMEIGTWNGRRALEMITCAKEHARAEEIEYYGFDVFDLMSEEILKEEISKVPPSLEQVREKLIPTGARVYLYRGFTQDTLPKATQTLPKMDLVFIDGGHSIETITNDWRYTQQVMGSHTIVVFDDYWSGGWGKRRDAGCQSLIDGLDRSKFLVKILSRQDAFQKEWGTLKINFVQVQRKQ